MLRFRLVWQLPWRRLVRQVMFDDMAGNIPVFIRLCYADMSVLKK